MADNLERELDWPSDRKFSDVKERPKIVVREGSWLIYTLWHEYGWKDTLQEMGITWPKFKDIYESVKFDFLRWRNGDERWDSAIKSLIDRVREEIEPRPE